MYPKVFHNVILMSAPFAGPPEAQDAEDASIHRDLARLSPPRKHYQWYFGEREAEANMLDAPGGFSEFLRAVKQSDKVEAIPPGPVLSNQRFAVSCM